MFKYARTKEFIVSTQPGERLSEAVPIKGATNVIVTRHNTTNSFCSSSSMSVLLYASYDGTNFKPVIINTGNGTSTSRFSYYHGTDQNINILDYDVKILVSGFNYMKLYNFLSTNTATCSFKVMVVS